MANFSTETMPRAGWRVERLILAGQEVRESSYVADEGPGLLVSPSFWLGGLLSLGVWTALAWALTS
ncbi:hypothetical protein WG902_12085 [Ramlibacter sp. PS3R-8]|uniref:hypothetical protein n=1 Tax=Ramlibacter sp. PS3R-8 TaxID=3133437 RepID=UPI0030AED2AA